MALRVLSVCLGGMQRCDVYVYGDTDDYTRNNMFKASMLLGISFSSCDIYTKVMFKSKDTLLYA